MNPDGSETITKTVREVSPDAIAIKYWLANKSKEKWRDRQEVEMNVMELPRFSGEDEL